MYSHLKLTPKFFFGVHKSKCSHNVQATYFKILTNKFTQHTTGSVPVFLCFILPSDVNLKLLFLI